ncbi:MAG: hypothetical protein CMJ19_17335 [Phycisphaeraceae bacterium]|nr:hypothetical protein [Phycisphaeraceae bacterium]
MKEKKLHSSLSAYERFEQVFRKYYDELFAHALVITESEARAKDVVADVFFNLWNSGSDLSGIRQIRAYLYTSVKNQALKSLSADPLKFHAEDYELKLYSIETIDPQEIMVGKELQDFLHKVIIELPPQCGVVFQLFHDKEMNHEEIAKELKISVETVRYHLKTALKKIRSRLDKEFDNSKLVNWYFSLLIIVFCSV